MRMKTYIDKDVIRRFITFNGWEVKPIYVYVQSAIPTMCAKK